MYSRPQRICVLALDSQSGPALAIFEPGSACGIPYAPELGFDAYTFQPLSSCHRSLRHENWLVDQPNDASMASAICCGEPEAAGGAAAAAGAAEWTGAGSLVCARLCFAASTAV